MCSKCKAEKDKMADESEKKAKHYHFRSYNPGVISQYLQHPKFSFVGSELQLRLTHRRAVTADFERLLDFPIARGGRERIQIGDLGSKSSVLRYFWPAAITMFGRALIGICPPRSGPV